MFPLRPNGKSLSSFLVLSWLLLLLLGTSTGDDNPGTTVHIQEIFTGRCYDYRQIKYKTLMPGVSEDCTSLWNKFFSAFSFMPPCAAMFWSGVKDLAHEYAADGQRYVTLEDTLIGYLVDGLIWCGQGIEPGMNYTRCPSWTDCPLETSESFWASASKTFASSASGDVYVMLDGSQRDKPAYRRDSETCTNGSLELLQADVTSRGFEFICEDDPQAILHLLCADNPSDRECLLASRNVYAYGPPAPYPAQMGRLTYLSPVINTKPSDRLATPVRRAIAMG
ncbi:hypothetical protein BaRGS_00028292 [Batillaria attramentaria]|uniref:ADP-ribosyl cyclase/cyclic ADP-ribose hydrolase n=1 Tax=Batillaria attramentaria TaxID=370345 RepID=A0ABD0K0V3_9CAEN